MAERTPLSETVSAFSFIIAMLTEELDNQGGSVKKGIR